MHMHMRCRCTCTCAGMVPSSVVHSRARRESVLDLCLLCVLHSIVPSSLRARRATRQSTSDRRASRIAALTYTSGLSTAHRPQNSKHDQAPAVRCAAFAPWRVSACAGLARAALPDALCQHSDWQRTTPHAPSCVHTAEQGPAREPQAQRRTSCLPACRQWCGGRLLWTLPCECHIPSPACAHRILGSTRPSALSVSPSSRKVSSRSSSGRELASCTTIFAERSEPRMKVA